MDLLLHLIELIHVLANLLIFLKHVLLNSDGELVQGALSWVLKGLPLEASDVVGVWSYINSGFVSIAATKISLLTSSTGIVNSVGEVSSLLVTTGVVLDLLNLLANSVKLTVDSCSGLVQLHQEI